MFSGPQYPARSKWSPLAFIFEGLNFFRVFVLLKFHFFNNLNDCDIKSTYLLILLLFLIILMVALWKPTKREWTRHIKIDKFPLLPATWKMHFWNKICSKDKGIMNLNMFERVVMCFGLKIWNVEQVLVTKCEFVKTLQIVDFYSICQGWYLQLQKIFPREKC